MTARLKPCPDTNRSCDALTNGRQRANGPNAIRIRAHLQACHQASLSAFAFRRCGTQAKGSASQTVTKLANDGKERAMFRVLERRFFGFDDEIAFGVKHGVGRQFRLWPALRPTGIDRERSSSVSSCRR